MTDPTPRDRELAGEVVKLTDERLDAERNRIADRDSLCEDVQHLREHIMDFEDELDAYVARAREMARARKEIARAGDFTRVAEIARDALAATSSTGATP